MGGQKNTKNIWHHLCTFPNDNNFRLIFTIYLFHFLGGIGAGQAQGGEAKKDRNGLWHGRDPQRGNPRVQGNSNVSVMQSKAKGRCTNQMLPLFLLRLPAYPLRNSSEKMPQVQCGFWCQRLSPPLFGLKSVVHFSLFTFSKIWTTAPQAPRAVTLSTQQTNKQTLWELTELKRPIFAA